MSEHICDISGERKKKRYHKTRINLQACICAAVETKNIYIFDQISMGVLIMARALDSGSARFCLAGKNTTLNN